MSLAIASPAAKAGTGSAKRAALQQLTLEYAVEFIDDDELVEITPSSIRLRKRFLKEHERKRAKNAALA